MFTEALEYFSPMSLGRVKQICVLLLQRVGFQCFELEQSCKAFLTGLKTVLLSCGMVTLLGERAEEPPFSKADSLRLCDEQALHLADVKTLGKGEVRRVLVLQGGAELLCPPGWERICGGDAQTLVGK